MNEMEHCKSLIKRNLPPEGSQIDEATLKLLAQWDEEDQTSDPDEIARRNRDFTELKEALNRNRIAAGGSNARRVFR